MIKIMVFNRLTQRGGLATPFYYLFSLVDILFIQYNKIVKINKNSRIRIWLKK